MYRRVVLFLLCNEMISAPSSLFNIFMVFKVELEIRFLYNGRPVNLIFVPGKAEQSRSSFHFPRSHHDDPRRHISEMILILDSHTVCVCMCVCVRQIEMMPGGLTILWCCWCCWWITAGVCVCVFPMRSNLKQFFFHLEPLLCNKPIVFHLEQHVHQSHYYMTSTCALCEQTEMLLHQPQDDSQ